MESLSLEAETTRLTCLRLLRKLNELRDSQGLLISLIKGSPATIHTNRNCMQSAQDIPKDTDSCATNTDTDTDTDSVTEGAGTLSKLNSMGVKVDSMLADLYHFRRKTTYALNILDTRNTQGNLLWFISDIHRMHANALEGTVTNIYSEPFHTSPHGYSMCCKLYPLGHQEGAGTHISIYFILMQSRYDNMLQFPFKQGVDITLINQSDSRQSITHTIDRLADDA